MKPSEIEPIVECTARECGRQFPSDPEDPR